MIALASGQTTIPHSRATDQFSVEAYDSVNGQEVQLRVISKTLNDFTVQIAVPQSIRFNLS